VIVAVNGAIATDPTTGIVMFVTPPATRAVLTAGFEFDVSVRFDADRLEVALAGHDVVRVMHAPLAEILA
jgi:uncharacterized protein (TIGR02217 family)